MVEAVKLCDFGLCAIAPPVTDMRAEYAERKACAEPCALLLQRCFRHAEASMRIAAHDRARPQRAF